MEADYINEGRTIPYTATGAIALGEVVVLGNKIAVANKAFVTGQKGALEAEGVFDFLKDNAVAFAVGVDVYWDAAANEATEDSDTNANFKIGYVVRAAADTDLSVRCYLSNDVVADHV